MSDLRIEDEVGSSKKKKILLHAIFKRIYITGDAVFTSTLGSCNRRMILIVVVFVVGLTIEICRIGIDDHLGPWVTTGYNWTYLIIAAGR